MYPRPSTREVFVELRRTWGGCTNATCGIAFVDATVTNPHPTRHQTVRLSFSRKFNIRNSALFDAEARVPGITGLSAQIWETAAGQPSGIPVQLSKNWHGADKDIIEWADELSSSSYTVIDSGYKYTYDRFNDQYRHIPLNADIAGLITNASLTSEAWYSPAGLSL